MIIYHNPRCRKSRETLELIRKEGQEPEIVEYLKNPLTADELRDIIDLLDIDAHDLIRTGEAVYKEDYKGKELSEEEWILAMAENPVLMERPIVVKGEKAVIGRPPENVSKLL
ncbi:MAG: arsenate reductase (glutaredoxin) [Vicingaceae bacterium]